jgi:hypothetical protein
MIPGRERRPILLAALLLLAQGCSSDWRTASRESAGIAPAPDRQPEAVVQVYAARAVKWRGVFAVHTWVAVKRKDAAAYTTYHLTGWRLRRGNDARRVSQDVPDRLWYGERPTLVAELVGPAAAAAIPKIEQAVAEYPYPNRYLAWPGPNSNTFVSYIVRRVPELAVELPPNAIGRDWLPGRVLVAPTESGTGAQLSLFGLVGFSAGAAEGIEVSLLGLDFGVDFLRPALKLPLIGRVGMRDEPPLSTRFEL